MPQEIQQAPAMLVENGVIHSGFFKTPLRRVNLLDARNLGGSLGKPLRWLRLKEWVGFAFDHPRLYGAMIIQNAKYAASGTAYVFDRQTRQLHEWLLIGLPCQVTLPESLWQGTSLCARGHQVLRFDHDLAHGRHTVHVRLPGDKHTPALATELVLHQDLATVDPLVVSLPIAPDHHTYTHKSPLRISGELRLGDAVFHYDPTRDLGNLDEQKTFYPYRSRWHWGTFAGLSALGQQIVLNVVDQMTPKGQPGEDALWIDGRMTLIDPPQFIADGKDGHFRLEDAAGRIRLTFVADGAKREKRAWIVASLDYAQYFGTYRGHVVDADGTHHAIDGIYGVIERMNARF